MSDTVWIVLIVALAVIVALFMFRSSLSRFFLKANKEGVEAELQTRDAVAGQTPGGGERAGVNISGNKQIGSRNKVEVGQNDVNIEDNLQLGQDQEIDVKPDQPL